MLTSVEEKKNKKFFFLVVAKRVYAAMHEKFECMRVYIKDRLFLICFKSLGEYLHFAFAIVNDLP